MSEIILEGLTPHQKAIAEMLWNIDSLEEVEELERTLGVDVTIVKNMIIAATLDEEQIEISKEVKDLLKKFSKKR